MSQHKVFLGDSHVHQLIVGVYTDKIQTSLQLGTESPTKPIMLLSIGVRVITRILAQMVESLGILQYSAITLCQCQELIQLPIKKTFRDMMSSESSFELIPGNHMISREHSVIVIPPHMC